MRHVIIELIHVGAAEGMNGLRRIGKFTKTVTN